MSKLKRGMRIANTSSSLSSEIALLVEELNAAGPTSHLAWISMVEREAAYIIALARLEAEDRKEQREAAEAQKKEERAE